MKNDHSVKTDKAVKIRSFRTMIAIISLLLLTILTIVVTTGCGFIKPINDQPVPTDNSSIEDGGTTSGKQFGVPSNGGYYSAH